ncbi:MAG: hypothetical protein HQL70_06030 [Magnetococcales bacterium]|nr:hypothetical protein [Magnetococcales bacterium]
MINSKTLVGLADPQTPTLLNVGNLTAKPWAAAQTRQGGKPPCTPKS